MLAIAFRFPAGRYHATPWGRHVNEAEVEWPPAPWRILRALIAIWHRKADHERHPETALESLIRAMASSLPGYQLPSAIRAHSRHYMPVRESRADKRVMIFDAFARVDPNAPLIMCWPELELSSDQLDLLDTLLANLGYLGRAESWVEAERLQDWDGSMNCRASELSVDTETGEILEPVQVLAPLPEPDYEQWRSGLIAEQGLDKKKPNAMGKRILRTLPERLLDALRLDTGDLQAAGWSCAPGARFVTYQRPEEVFRPRPQRPTRGKTPEATISTARLALAGKPLPRIEDALRIGELARVAALHKADRLVNGDEVPGVLSGHGLPKESRHGHAFYLPEDADGDGHIDHILVHAHHGLSGTPLRALDRISLLWEKGGSEWRVLLEQYGSLEAIAGSSYTGPARQWISVTPYLHPWYRKKSLTVEDQIRRECRERGLPDPEIEYQQTIPVRGRERRSVHFHRFRSKRGLRQPDTRGGFWQLTFPEPIDGPLALGFGCHYGLGIFRGADGQ